MLNQPHRERWCWPPKSLLRRHLDFLLGGRHVFESRWGRPCLQQGEGQCLIQEGEAEIVEAKELRRKAKQIAKEGRELREKALPPPGE